MNVKELDKWYKTKEYDPEGKEIARIIKLSKPRAKNVLLVGTYGTMFISFNLLKYTISITVVHKNEQIINYCREKNKKINFQVGDITKTKFQDKFFDVIISPWCGLQYQKGRCRIIREFRRILKDEGTLLLEEADGTSEFIKILNLIVPNRKSRLSKKQDELRSILRSKGFYVKERRLKTYYDFRDNEQFKNYFKKEIIFNEKRKFTKETEQKLEKYISKRRSFRVEEKSIFFICKKSRVSY